MWRQRLKKRCALIETGFSFCSFLANLYKLYSVIEKNGCSPRKGRLVPLQSPFCAPAKAGVQGRPFWTPPCGGEQSLGHTGHTPYCEKIFLSWNF